MTDAQNEISARWVLVPVEPTPEMLLAYRLALREHIASVPVEQRAARRKAGRKHGYRVPEREKSIIRYKAMVEAASRLRVREALKVAP